MRSFLNACGLTEPIRLTIEGPRPGEARPWPLPQPFAVLGRDPRADLILDDLKVSRRHLYLQAIAGGVFWMDLESRTGTCDATGSRKWGWLNGGELLQLGPFVIRREGGDPSPPCRESPLIVRSIAHETLPGVSLEFLNGPSERTVWPMNRVISLIGSARGCKFRLTDPSVSAFHASLLRTPTGLWVVDLRGGRSLSINAEPIRFGPLVEGDVLGIGRYRIRVRVHATDESLDPEAGSSVGWSAPSVQGALARRPTPAVPSIAAFSGFSTAMPMPPMVASAAGVELVHDSGRTHPEITESALVPLVHQFSMMQQQMFDQFQQAMGMLVQMFSSMHREQMDVIREELDRLHDLTRELQELREELAQSSARPAPAAAPARPIPTLPPRSQPVSPPKPAEIPSASVAPASAPTSSPAARPGPTRPVVPPPTDPRPDQAAPGVASPQDAVAWIHQRIAAIQQERETRWQKIVKLLPGMS